MAFPFERRAVAYFDILGWKQSCVDAARGDTALAQQLYLIAQTLHSTAIAHTEAGLAELKTRIGTDPSSQRFYEIQSLCKVSAFSDNVVMSIPEKETPFLLSRAAVTCLHLLRQGFLVRGGVTIGDLYHNEGVVFGPGLVSAVTLENDASLPRILFSPEVRSHLEAHPVHQVSVDMIFKDVLGRDTLNFFTHAQDYRSQDSASVAALREKLELGLSKASSDPHRQEKWRYMQEAVEGMLRPQFAQGAG